MRGNDIFSKVTCSFVLPVLKTALYPIQIFQHCRRRSSLWRQPMMRSCIRIRQRCRSKQQNHIRQPWPKKVNRRKKKKSTYTVLISKGSSVAYRRMWSLTMENKLELIGSTNARSKSSATLPITHGIIYPHSVPFEAVPVG